MNKDLRDTLIVIAAAAGVVAVMFSGIFVYSGVWPPFSVVESGSMQHGEESSIGIIDTGDMVVVRDKSKTDIVSYVEGYHTGYGRFGEYGDVVIYERMGNGNPIIHRAILWLEYIGDDGHGNTLWSAPDLANYTGPDGTPYWSNGHNTDPTRLTGPLTLHNIGYSSKTPEIDLDRLHPVSGYLTMGDNGKTNPDFDQTASFSLNRLVSDDRIRYVAGQEIPWIGCIKLYTTGTNVSEIPENSIPSMLLGIVVIICTFVALFVTIDFVEWYRDHGKGSGRRVVIKETPPPLHFHWRRRG